jgi:hypothetical protein
VISREGIKPAFSGTTNRGAVLHELDRNAEALASCDEALAITRTMPRPTTIAALP